MTRPSEIALGSCGLRSCSICEALGASQARPVEEILDELDKAAKAGSAHVRFVGHEMLAHPGRARILERCARLGLTFLIPSSGRHVRSAKRLTDLKRLGLAGVDYWFTSFTPEVHQVIENLIEDAERPALGLEQVLEAGLLKQLRIPVVPFNRGELDKTFLSLLALYDLYAEFFDPQNRFPTEIARANRRVAERLGQKTVARPSFFAFRPQASAERFPFDPNDCPLIHADQANRLPPNAAWLEVEPGLYQAFATQTEEITSLLLAKNLRGLLRRGETHYSRHPACIACPKLSRCGLCFIPKQPSATDSEKGPTSSSSAISPDALWAVLATQPEQIEVQGRSPVCIAFDEREECPAPHPTFEPWELADQAAFWGYGVSDYELSRKNTDGSWRLTFTHKPEILEQRAKGLAVLQISSACVARCIMCALPLRYAGQWVHTDDTAHLLEELYILGYQVCDIFGGEITLRPDFYFLMALAKEIGMRTYIITTGHNVDRSSVQRLGDLGVDKITVSVDSSSASLHDAIKRRPGLFKHAQEAIVAVLEDGRIPLEVNTVILRQNVYDLPDLHDYLAELGVRRHRLFFCVDSFEGMREPPFLTPEQVREFFKDIKPRLLAISEKRGTLLDWCPENLTFGENPSEEQIRQVSEGRFADPTVGCSGPQAELFVLVDGSVYPCVSPNCVEAEAVGKIGDQSILQILTSDAFKRFREEAGSMPVCKICISKRHGTLVPGLRHPVQS